MTRWHHRSLPQTSTLLVGREPRDATGFPSGRLQVWYNRTAEVEVDVAPHLHRDSDECFVMLRGSMVVEVEGERHTVGPREFCCFPSGVVHQVVATVPPLESLVMRAPSIDDKEYP